MTVAPIMPICPVARPLAERPRSGILPDGVELGELRGGEVLTRNLFRFKSPGCGWLLGGLRGDDQHGGGGGRRNPGGGTARNGVWMGGRRRGPEGHRSGFRPGRCWEAGG